MGFNLSAFAGGFATAASEKFEEERKIAQAAVSGRIARAAETNKRKLKETTELRSSLEEQLADIEQVVGPDETLQKAFLTSPTAFSTYKEQKLKGEALDPYKFITINKDKLFAGSSKDFIIKLTEGAAATVAPETPKAFGEPTSFFAPSQKSMKGYTESAAMSAGMTMDEVQRAEAYTGLKKPESVATINFDTLMKPAKVVPVKDRMEKAMAAADDAKQKGDAKGFEEATARYNDLKLLDTTLNPKQAEWADYVGQLKYKMLKGTPEEQATANKEYDRVIKIEQLNDKKPVGEGESKIPAEGALASLFKNAGANAVTAKYGKSLKDDLIVATDSFGNSSFQYVGTNPTIQAEIQDVAKAGIADVAKLYTDKRGVPLNRSVAAALTVNGIRIGEGGVPMFATGPRVGGAGTGGAPRAFATVQEAEAANLPKGTKITIGGRPAEVQ